MLVHAPTDAMGLVIDVHPDITDAPVTEVVLPVPIALVIANKSPNGWAAWFKTITELVTDDSEGFNTFVHGILVSPARHR